MRMCWQHAVKIKQSIKIWSCGEIRHLSLKSVSAKISTLFEKRAACVFLYFVPNMIWGKTSSKCNGALIKTQNALQGQSTALHCITKFSQEHLMLWCAITGRHTILHAMILENARLWMWESTNRQTKTNNYHMPEPAQVVLLQGRIKLKLQRSILVLRLIRAPQWDTMHCLASSYFLRSTL